MAGFGIVNIFEAGPQRGAGWEEAVVDRPGNGVTVLGFSRSGLSYLALSAPKPDGPIAARGREQGSIRAER